MNFWVAAVNVPIAMLVVRRASFEHWRPDYHCCVDRCDHPTSDRRVWNMAPRVRSMRSALALHHARAKQLPPPLAVSHIASREEIAERCPPLRRALQEMESTGAVRLSPNCSLGQRR